MKKQTFLSADNIILQVFLRFRKFQSLFLQISFLPFFSLFSFQDSYQFSSVKSLSHVQLFATPWTAEHQASLSITNSQSLLKFMSVKLVMPLNHLITVVPFSSHLQSFPASRSFPMSLFFTSGGQNIGVSASTSVLPMNIQD